MLHLAFLKVHLQMLINPYSGQTRVPPLSLKPHSIVDRVITKVVNFINVKLFFMAFVISSNPTCNSKAVN